MSTRQTRRHSQPQNFTVTTKHNLEPIQCTHSTMVAPPLNTSELINGLVPKVFDLDHDQRGNNSTLSADCQFIDYNCLPNNTYTLSQYLMSQSATAVDLTSEDVVPTQAGLEQLIGLQESGNCSRWIETPECRKPFMVGVETQAPQPYTLPSSSPRCRLNMETYLNGIYTPGLGSRHNHMPAIVPYWQNIESPIQRDPELGAQQTQEDFQQSIAPHESSNYVTGIGNFESPRPFVGGVVNQILQPYQLPAYYSSFPEKILNSRNGIHTPGACLGSSPPPPPAGHHQERRPQSRRKDSWYKCRFKSCTTRNAERSDNLRKHLKMDHAKELYDALGLNPNEIPHTMKLTKIINSLNQGDANLWREHAPSRKGYSKRSRRTRN
ncbi:hypothetical protein BDZ91DRAFT_799270 [Kalaharituber pfeilii]|nr:hypothetical protein BDZ91DRAFT_799270 [Kalaharituber pfeilii]